jgi:transposase
MEVVAMKSVTHFELAWELFLAGQSAEEVGLVVGRDRATIYRWVSAFKRMGIREFVRRKQECKRRRQKRKITGVIPARIKSIRRKRGWCGQKIQKELFEKDGVIISVPTIYRILKEDIKLGKASKKYKHRGNAPKAYAPREVIEHDTVDFGEVFAHTSIDIFTKEPCVVMVTDLESNTGIRAFRKQKAFYGEAVLHQSDEGPEFKKSYPRVVESYGSKHRYSRPYKKNDQSHIENFNRCLRSECLGWTKYKKRDIFFLQRQVDEYTRHYINERWHMGLPDMMTPAQFKSCYNENRNNTLVVAFAP